MIKPVDLINCISVFQLAYFTFYLFHKGGKTQSNKLLAAFFIAQFLVIANNASNNIFQFYNIFHINTVYITLPVWFLWGPLMYFYVKLQLNKSFKIKALHLLHLIPFLIGFLYAVVAYVAVEFELKSMVFLNAKLIHFSLLMNVQVICYNSLSIITLTKYQNRLKNVSSSVEKQNLTWLKTVLFGYILACIVVETMFFFGNKILVSNEIKEVLLFTAFLIFFNVLFYKAMINPYVFIEIEEKSKHVAVAPIDSDNLKYIPILEEYINKNKPYLNTALTIKELAESAGIGERIISQIINQHYNKNFYTYINSYRIEEAKALINSKKLQNSTMLGIAFDAGFNSKTVFYDTFKKYVGMTPSEYRQMCA